MRSSRYSPQFGKGSGGLVDLQVQDGDNRFRFNATDFFPTFQNVKGFQLNNWTPRGYFSGPLVKDKLWFDISHEGEVDYNIIKELPEGADTNRLWRTADLGRLRMNLTPGNVLTASAVLNLQDSQNSGISAFDPVSVSLHNHNYLYLLGLKDQITIAQGHAAGVWRGVPSQQRVVTSAGRSSLRAGSGRAAPEITGLRTKMFPRARRALPICICVRGSWPARTSSLWAAGRTA